MVRKLQVLDNLYGKSAYEVAKVNGFDGSEVEWLESLKGVPGKDGASRWNDLIGRPFGETTVMSDTLTWDGNTEGLVTVEIPNAGGVAFVKISDVVPPVNAFANGVTVMHSDGNSYEMQADELMIEAEGFFYGFEGTFYVVAQDNFDYAGMITLPKAGIYTSGQIGQNDKYLASLTIPGYTGFETTTITPIDKRYLPEALQFGEETKMVEGDTLYWDGNRSGHASVADMVYKISDNVLTLDDVQNGATVTASDGTSQSYSGDEIREFSNAYGIVCFGGVYAIPSANYDIQGMVFPEAGVYVMAAASNPVYTESITIPGYNGFVSEQTVIKTIDPKFLPEGVSYGYTTVASGNYSHAEGYTTVASGNYSHAEGNGTIASGLNSHAEGNGTIASQSHQHVQGKYNIDNNACIHIVGNGVSDTDRKNIHTVGFDGSGWFQGDVYVGSTSGVDKDSGSRKLIPSPTNAVEGDLLTYDGTNWVRISKADLIAEIIAALPSAE